MRKMTTEEAQKIVHEYGGALADTPKGDLVRYWSKLPCEKAEIKKAFHIFLKKIIKYQNPSEDELNNFALAYGALNTFADDDKTKEINEIAKKISKKEIDISDPKNSHEKEIFNKIAEFVPSAEMTMEMQNLIETYKKEVEGMSDGEKQDDEVKEILAELKAKNNEPLTVEERKIIERLKRADRRGQLLIFSIIILIVGWYSYDWYINKYYKDDFQVYACPENRNSTVCYNLKADVSLAEDGSPSTVDQIYFNNGGYISFDNGCSEIKRNKKWNCMATNDENANGSISEWNIEVSSKTRVKK